MQQIVQCIVLLLAVLAACTAADDCADVDTTYDIRVEDILILQGQLEGDHLCFRATSIRPTDAIGVGFSRGVPSSPLTFAVFNSTVEFFQVDDNSTMVPVATPTWFTLLDSARRPRTMLFTMDASVVPPIVPIVVHWFFKANNSMSRGSMDVAISSDGMLHYVESETYLVVLGTIVVAFLVAMLVLRVSFRRFDRKLMPPPQFSSTCFALQSILGDLSLGEWCLVLVYMTGLIVVISAVPYDTDDTAVGTPRLVSVFCGHMSMIHLAFLIVPVSQLGWWLNLAQSRLIKFHKGLSFLFLATTVVHLGFSIKANRPSRVFWNPELITSQNVRPLYGSLAFICFLIMSITATAMVRRHYYEIFLIVHRVMFVLGVVFVCLHNHVVRLSLICPMAVYGLCGLIVRVPPFLTKYQMDVDITGSHTVLLTLPLTPQTHKWVTGYRLCSHIYLNVPAISSFEWHPFALVVTPHHDAIAVCIKITKPFSFTHKLHRLCQTTPSLTVKLAGPYGQPTVDLRQYQQVVLVGGGIGITPLLGAINHLDKHSRVKLHLAWVVRHADELLCCQAIMFPLPPFVTCEFYVSLAVSRGVVMTETGDAVSYFPGRFVIDDVLRSFQNIPDTCVLACGPQAMVVETQREAYDRGFDFQKVVYAF
ncbi:hypothetical protein Ae201684_010163 [Aphanomyces euteiches]|uniref:FAD-binding FR-type domain-containing protein n=1 Tax=Aphanomyces euteiches TaxID=100861 RepID=A0A6G0WZA3_9STRA|nr:hypothetical protein Ae201684_010163 [Aphanomyces euteiches]